MTRWLGEGLLSSSSNASMVVLSVEALMSVSMEVSMDVSVEVSVKVSMEVSMEVSVEVAEVSCLGSHAGVASMLWMRPSLVAPWPSLAAPWNRPNTLSTSPESCTSARVGAAKRSSERSPPSSLFWASAAWAASCFRFLCASCLATSCCLGGAMVSMAAAYNLGECLGRGLDCY